MALLYYDPVFLEHQWPGHPERPERLSQVARHLERTGLSQRCARPTWQPITLERLSLIHSLVYARQIEQLARRGGGLLDEDTYCTSRSYDIALQAAGAACDAVDRVLRGEETQALCLVRPPGHHALRDAAMGFCLFNNVALAARLAIAEWQLDRVLIVDWDVHHGNGTQAAFWEDEQVGFLSIHRWPFYPGTGSADETGGGRAVGTKLNLPIEFGTPQSAYLEIFSQSLERLAARMKPQLVLISAGFDSHHEDPIGSLGLDTEAFIRLTQCVLEVAATHAGGRLVSVLEGGYNPGILAACVEAHLLTLMAPNDASGPR